LIETLQWQGFSFQTFANFLEKPENKIIILRQDIDRLPMNTLEFARIQAKNGITGTYFFRMGSKGFKEKIIEEIYSLGHEIGYHYEDVSTAAERQKTKGKRQKWLEHGSGFRVQGEEPEKLVVDIGIASFRENLEKIRKIVPVKTVCMHGSPLSRWDSRLLWKYYDYRDFGIIGEPYFDLNFEQVLYLTDAGRRWNGAAVSVRDKAGSNGVHEGAEKFSSWKVQPTAGSAMNMTCKAWEFQKNHNFRSTKDIMSAVEGNMLPDKIMITFHPQRWTDKPLQWACELLLQNTKNVIKYFIVKRMT